MALRAVGPSTNPLRTHATVYASKPTHTPHSVTSSDCKANLGHQQQISDEGSFPELQTRQTLQ